MTSIASTNNRFSTGSTRMLHGGLAVLAVFSFACCCLALSTFCERLKQVASEYYECQSIYQTKGETIEAMAITEQRHVAVSEEFQSLLSRIPKQIADSDVLSSVRGIAQSARCSLADFRPGEIQKQSEFQSRSYEIRVEGKFNTLFGFFESLQDIPYAYQLGRFKITEPAVAGGACRMDLELKVLFDHIWSAAEPKQ